MIHDSLPGTAETSSSTYYTKCRRAVSQDAIYAGETFTIHPAVSIIVLVPVLASSCWGLTRTDSSRAPRCVVKAAPRLPLA